MQEKVSHNRNAKAGFLQNLVGMCRRLRIWYVLHFRYRFLSVGKDFYIGYRTYITANRVRLGDYCYIGNNCHITTYAEMGNWVMIASNVSMIGGDHSWRTPGVPMRFSGPDEKNLL